MSPRQKASSAFDASLQTLFEEPDRVHPEIRRYAIDLLANELGKWQLFENAAGLALAKVVVHLYEGYDHSHVDRHYWPALGQIYREVGDLMVSVGVRPQLVWPGHDAQNAPTWAEVVTSPERRSQRA